MTKTLIVVAVTAAFGLAACGPAAKTTDGVPQGDTLDSIKQLPDWSGAWQATSFLKQVKEYGRGPFEVVAPLKPQAAAQLARLKKLSDEGGDVPTKYYHCVPHGMPGGMDGPDVMLEFLFTPGRVTITDETGWVRRIHTDGRPHNEDSISFQGDSIGHWEGGGVLVVDTIGLDPGNEFILGIEQGENSHVTERIHRTSADDMVDEIVLEAPDVLTGPWAYTTTYKRRNESLVAAECLQNNRDVGANGRQTFDLTPPK